jgi:hypothetical protein
MGKTFSTRLSDHVRSLPSLPHGVGPASDLLIHSQWQGLTGFDTGRNYAICLNWETRFYEPMDRAAGKRRVWHISQVMSLS